MEFVTLVNRLEAPLWATWDGKKYQLKSGKNALPLIVAEAAKRQNPIMGTEDPYTLQMQYKVGIEEQGDDTSPLKDFKETIERFDRSQLRGSKPTQVVAGNNGLYSVTGQPLANQVRSSLPLDSSFVDPKV